MIQNIAGMLVGQDFGTWSRADIERIAGAAGWPVQDGEYHLTFDTGGPVRARSMKISYGQDDFGFGAHTDLQVSETCAADALADLHAATLAAVVAVLGPPAMVGGPHAWTFWRNPRVRLERDLQRSTVTLRIEPAEPAEAEEYTNAEHLPGWRPAHLWNAEPDVHNAAAESLGGMMIYEAQPAETWDEFESSLRDLFVSLAADMPALLDYVPHVGWEINEAAGDHALQGSFRGAGVYISSFIYNTTEETISPTWPLEPASGTRAADIALEAIRGWNLATPADLRYECFIPGPVRLSATSGFRIPPA